MNKLFEAAESYIKKMSVWDMALVKFCLCSVGIMIGATVPKKCKKGVVFTAVGVFTVTYLALMVPFLKTLEDTLKDKN